MPLLKTYKNYNEGYLYLYLKIKFPATPDMLKLNFLFFEDLVFLDEVFFFEALFLFLDVCEVFALELLRAMASGVVTPTPTNSTKDMRRYMKRFMLNFIF